MAVSIGPKIGLDGEAEYRKQLQNIIQQQKTLKAEMESTTSGFDKNTTAMAKAKATTENLNKQIALQKTRVEEAKKMVEESTAKYGEADNRTLKWKEALANANTELNKMEAQLKEVGSPLEAFGKDMQAAGEKVSGIGDKITSVGTSMTKNITTPILGVGAASIAAFSEVDKGMDAVAVMTGATGEALESLQNSARTVAKTLPTTFETAGQAVGEVNTRFGVTGEELEKITSDFIKFAQINETDVVKSVDDVQSAMTAWGLEADKTGAVLDTITKVAQNTGTSVDTLSAGIGENAVVFQQMGFSISDAAAFLGELDKNGIDSSTAMAGLKKALQNATKDGKTMTEALSDLQTTLTSSETDTEAYTAAMELFGNKAGPQLAAALADGRLSLDALGTSLETNLGTVSTTFENTLDAPDQLQVTLNNLKDTGAQLGGTLLDMLTPAIQGLNDVVQKAGEWWSSLDESQQKTILTVAGVIAAVGPVVTIIGKVTSGIGNVISVGGKLIAGIGTLGLSLGPTIAIVAGVAAAIAGVILVIKNWDKITEWFSKTWETVTTAVSDAATAVGDWVSDKWNAIKDWTSEAWNNVKDTVTNTWENMKTGVKDAADTVGNWVSEKWDNIKEKTSEIWNNVKETVSNAWDNVKDGVKNAVDSVGDWISDKWDNIKEKTSEAWDNVKSKIEENGGGIKGFIKTAAEESQNVWEGAFDAINNATGGKLGDALTTVQGKVADIKAAFEDKLNAAREFVGDAIDKIKGFFDFHWELPKIKMPHFSISGEFSLSPLRVPHLSVEWYKKAYSNPVMFTQPTVLATSNGLKGFGDGQGGEIVIGQSMLYGMIRDAAMDGMKTENRTYGDINVNVYGAPGQDVNQLAELVADRINHEVQRREAAWA